MRVFIDEIPIDLFPRENLFGQMTEWLTVRHRSRQIVTLNALMWQEARRNPTFRQVVRRADLITIDGYGIELCLHRNGYQTAPRIAGIDLVRELLNRCAGMGCPVYCYGGPKDLPLALRSILAKNWPGLTVAGLRDGFGHSLAETEVIREILRLQPGLLLTGLGSPRQELFLADILPRLGGTVGIGVGGALEVLAGHKREAPAGIRKRGWEWLYRMALEPRRIKHLPDLIDFWFHQILFDSKQR
jgi:N-acetylglucosaminyldiphosphoundecaprenol N-acetyl-beta-D-mannosaminyltransferase